MKIAVTAQIPFPRNQVFKTYRDRLVELVPYMPSIWGVEVISQVQEGDRLTLVNEWHGGGDIPAAARAILNETMLSWTEYALWNSTNFTTDWHIQTHAYREAVHCAGLTRFIEDADHTVVESRGELRIDPHKIEGVPSFISGMVSGIVEDFLSKKIVPNLLQMGDGVRLYLEKQSLDVVQR